MKSDWPHPSFGQSWSPDARTIGAGGFAYATAATACIALLTFYLRHPLGTSRRTASFFAMFVVLYGALYGLLKSEDHALLLGSLLVFLLLAIAMVATRKIEWSVVSARLAASVGPTPRPRQS